MEEAGAAGRQDDWRTVYCAVGMEAGKEWRANLRWVLANFPRNRTRLVLAHIYRPPTRINIMGAWVPVTQLGEQEVAAYMHLEEEKTDKVLDNLLAICRSRQVQASKIIIAGDDTTRGLLQLIADHGVTEFVMGAAPDRGYTKKMRKPASKKALKVQRKANPSCKIWFVCQGNLICTREATSLQGVNRTETSTASTSPRSNTLRSSPSLHSEPLSMDGRRTDSTASSLHSASSRDDGTMDHIVWDFNHKVAVPPRSLTELMLSETAEAAEGSAGLQPLQEVEDDSSTLCRDGSDGAGGTGGALYEKLKEVLLEAENLKRQMYEEARRREKAEQDLAEASRMARDAESSRQAEAKQREEVEERLARERAAMERDKQELAGILEQIQKVQGRRTEPEVHIAERATSGLEVRMSESYGILDTLRRDRPAAAAGRGSSSSSSMDAAHQGVGFFPWKTMWQTGGSKSNLPARGRQT